jgi:hypothetical protein
MAKAKPGPKPKAPARPATPKPATGPPSRASVVKIILDDLTSPMTPADAAELFAVSVMDKLRELAPDVMANFTPAWGDVFIDLAVAVVNRCDEDQVKAMLEKLPVDGESSAADADGEGWLLFRVLRRRFARSLPDTVEPKISSVGRYWLSVAAIEAARDAADDDELWEALWGRKAGWYPIKMLAREAPGTKPLGDDGVVEPEDE